MDRQPDRIPQRGGDQACRRQGRDVRRGLRDRAHASGQGHAHRRLREPEDNEKRLSYVAQPRRCLRRGVADPVCRQREDDFAGPAAILARAGGSQAAHGRSQQCAAAGARQLLARHPGADRRRAGVEAGAESLAGATRDQYARADPEGRLRRQLLHARLRRLAAGKHDQRSMDAGVDGAIHQEGGRRHRPDAVQGRDRRPARRRPQGQPEALAGQRRAHHLHAAGRERIDRVQGPARFRSHRRHRAPVGVQYDERRADRHDQQQLLRAAVGTLVQ